MVEDLCATDSSMLCHEKVPLCVQAGFLEQCGGISRLQFHSENNHAQALKPPLPFVAARQNEPL